MFLYVVVDIVLSTPTWRTGKDSSQCRVKRVHVCLRNESLGLIGFAFVVFGSLFSVNTGGLPSGHRRCGSHTDLIALDLTAACTIIHVSPSLRETFVVWYDYG